MVQLSSSGKHLKSCLLDPLNRAVEGTQIIERLSNVNASKNCRSNFIPVGMSLSGPGVYEHFLIVSELCA